MSDDHPWARAYRDTRRPSQRSREGNWEALQERIEAGEAPPCPAPTAVHDEDREPQPELRPAAAPVGKVAAIAALAAAALLLVWGAGRVVATRGEATPVPAASDVKAKDAPSLAVPREPTAGPSRTTMPTRQVAPPAGPDPEPDTRPAIVPEPPGKRGTAPPPPSVAADPFAEELGLMQAARRALNDGNPQGAIEHVRAHAQRFPRGSLAAERHAIEVDALCAQSRPKPAQEAAQRFLAAHPGSAAAKALVATPCPRASGKKQ